MSMSELGRCEEVSCGLGMMRGSKKSLPSRESKDPAFGQLHFSPGLSLERQVGGFNVLQLIRLVFREALCDP